MLYSEHFFCFLNYHGFRKYPFANNVSLSIINIIILYSRKFALESCLIAHLDFAIRNSNSVTNTICYLQKYDYTLLQVLFCFLIYNGFRKFPFKANKTFSAFAVIHCEKKKKKCMSGMPFRNFPILCLFPTFVL